MDDSTLISIKDLAMQGTREGVTLLTVSIKTGVTTIATKVRQVRVGHVEAL